MSEPNRSILSAPSVLSGSTLLTAGLLAVLASCGGGEEGGVVELEVRESSELAVAAHPSEERVVFTLLGGLWSVSDTGGLAERLTDSTRVARDPVWGPEGRRLAFVSVQGSRHAIAVLEGVGAEPSLLLEGMRPFAAPAWSPDATRLAFVAGSGTDCELRTVPAEGPIDEREQVWSEGVACGSAPAWTPDGLVVVGPGSNGESNYAATDLWRVGEPGAEPTRLLEGGGERWAPLAETEGSLLYLERRREGISLRRFPAGEEIAGGLPTSVGRPTTRSGSDGSVFVPAEGRIWRLTEGGERQEVPFRASITVRRPSYERRVPDIALAGRDTARGIFAPRISPDGRRVAFSAMGDVWVMPLDSAAQPEPVITGPAEETMPAWSPDGSWIAYVSNQDGDFDLWVAAADGGERTRLTRLEGDEREPVWDPTGRRIAFSFFDNRTVDLFWVPAEGGEPRRITEHREQNWDLSPAWGPEGRRLAFLRRTAERSTPHVAVVRPGEASAAPVALDLEELPITALAWSPSGELVYRTGGVLRAAVLEGNAARRIDRPLNGTRVFHPSFDARGERLLYLSTDGLRLRGWPAGEERRVPVPLAVPGRDEPVRLTIRNVRLIDGTGAAPRGPVDLRLDGGRIVEIVEAGQASADGNEGRVIDGSDLTALPGLIDMHTHLFHYGMRAYLGTGVTTVRDVGFESHLVASRWEGVRSGRLAGPRIVYAGEFLDGPGGKWMGNFVVTVTSAEQVRREVARLADFGVGWIKTYVRMPPELRLAAIEAAHAHGLPATQHEIFPALAWGADGKEHVRGGWREDLRSVITASRAWMIPTLETGSGSFLYMRDHPEVWEREDVRGLVPRYVRTSFRTAVAEADSSRVSAMRDSYADEVAATRRLREEGARLAVGTDPTNPFVLFGVGVHWELEHLVEAGFSPLEALHLASGAAARALGLEDEIGTVAEGKRADLVLVEGDPAVDVSDTRRIRWVVLGGEPMRPETLHWDRLAGARDE